ELTAGLIARGRRRIAFIAARVPWPVVEERHVGYLEAHDDAGLTPPEDAQLFEATWAAHGGWEMTRKLLSLPTPVDAIMCGSDALAVGAKRAVHLAGLRVPDDVAVTGFNDFDFASFAEPPLTTVAVPTYEMGRIAARLLMDRLKGVPIPSPQ